MDPTGEDLAHVAKEIDWKIEKQALHSSNLQEVGQTGKAEEEKPQQYPASSKSSSEDASRLEKPDSRIFKVTETKDGDEAYAHLPPHEKDIIKKQLDIPSVKVTYQTLFRYATRNDLIIIYISSLCAIVGGAIMPLMTVSDARLMLGIEDIC